MTPSAEQAAYFEWVRNSTGNALVSAVAGSGKTTTLVHGFSHMSGSICAMAYNKKAAIEMQTKAEALGSAARAAIGTVHSFGYAILRHNKIFPKPDEWARFNKLSEKFGIERDQQVFFKNALSMAKQRGFGLPGEPEINDLQAWADMAYTFSLEDDLPQSGDLTLEAALARCPNLLKSAKYDTGQFIDFDDMIWLPLVLQLPPSNKFNWVLLDEAQDTNPARRCLARHLLHPSGRFVAVGDPAQAIYGFTGADNDSLSLIERDFNTRSLPLHTSFRCGKAIIAEARHYVSHITAHESNEEGAVETLNLDSEPNWLAKVAYGDAILCRNTRPLIALAFQLIKSGRAAKVEGRKIGEGLKALAKKFRYHSRTEFDATMAKYAQDETKKLREKKKNFAAALVQDKVESLLCVADSLAAFSRQALLDKIDSIFAEGAQANSVLLCTIHRAKGLEWDTVYWHLPGKYQPSPFAQQDWELEQESNLCYVAVTRAKKKLIITEKSND